ncbi:hydantoinase/oxoprolinase family protein [Microbaculum marinisediminis]|uniref:Hydantoinase/oxoprolinase family protein n=1 Tax=Microbaculum marinisediminis TaxID=2931392 RepID=A0AAW5R1S3_9HYPH|nr:hydantoinase/oxoprolinase family protein [Microbaculum sp. A6E488]MCT8974246.1 hydantoinase/oxoprolinase family protein [Microbaculum sp. A6E488]
MKLRVGADVGGTFTDIVLVSDDGSIFEFGKILTTPRQPDDAIIEGVDRVLTAAAADRAGVESIVHGTTLFTNALIERKGARTAMITTKGFRDAVEIAREHRYEIYDLRIKRPNPLAPRRLRFELDERMLADGTVRKSLDDDDVRALVKQLVRDGVEAVGVSLFHSYVNDAHERRVGEILAEDAPHISVSLSCDLVPEIGEYMRGSTVLANVYVKRIAEGYLKRLRERAVSEAGLKAPLFIIQSDGGLCDIEEAAQKPIRLIESGPVGGALAAAHYGALLGYPDILAFDMGGTTAKACVIADGEPLITNEFEVDRQYQFKKHSGLPVKVPVVEMIEIGTGGGSVARVDAMKRLRVGPDSSGAEPGPACYGRGGDEPTVTDANLVLGYLDPDFFLGGRMKLDVERARNVIQRKIADPLGLSPVEAAYGIHQLANESMASAARIHTIERGKNIATFPLFATGGAGPMHAYGVASILRCPSVGYPLGAGVMSALGFLTAPISTSLARSRPRQLKHLDWEETGRLIEEMKAEARTVVAQAVGDEDLTFKVFADMRYVLQGSEVRVPIEIDDFERSRCDEVMCAFEQVYTSIYGHTMNADAEVVSWRVVAQGRRPELVLKSTQEGAPRTVEAAVKGRRDIYISEVKQMQPVNVYDRYLLPPGATFEGPAIVEERESTVVINGSATVSVDEYCNLVVNLKHAG